jgi:hypothetical protein
VEVRGDAKERVNEKVLGDEIVRSDEIVRGDVKA